jgi:AhpD family alkylhydroperoxidase
VGKVLRATLRATPSHLRRVDPVRRRAASGLVARVYDQVLRDFGVLAPPVALHSPAPGPLAAAWVILRETLVADGLVDRASKEAVAAAVSLGNSCPYCVQVHSATMHGLVRGADAMAVAQGRLEDVADGRTRAIAEWARASGSREGAAAHPLPALSRGEAAELIGVAVTFHYFNRVVNVFLTDSPFPGAPVAARGLLLRIFGRYMRPSSAVPHAPGDGLALLPDAALPAEVTWAANATIAGAFARASRAVSAAGEAALPAPARELVAARLAGWHGEPVGISRAWAEEAVSALEPAQRPAGRLALLTAFASYQVDEPVVVAARQAGAGDAELVALTSWAALAAATRVGAWLWDELARPTAAA